jgi:hypothetical protein
MREETSAMDRGGERIRLLLGAAAICGLLVVPVALAGSAPSAGGPKATASAAVKKKLKSLQRQIDALKAQVGKPGPQGAQGIQGTQGPGAISFDRQFPADSTFHQVTTVNGLVLRASCSVIAGDARVEITQLFHGWGTKAEDGALSSASVSPSNFIEAAGIDSADLDVVAISTAPVEPGKWTRIDANVIRGSACNFHGMVIPSSSVG